MRTKKKEVLTNKYIMNSIIYCITSYKQLLPEYINYYYILKSQKNRVGQTKKLVGKKLDGLINWVGQTLNRVGQCPAGPSIALPLLPLHSNYNIQYATTSFKLQQQATTSFKLQHHTSYHLIQILNTYCHIE